MHESQSTPRVAILGCGYVGSALGRALVHRGCSVVGTTQSGQRNEELRQMGITPRILEIGDPDQLSKVLADRDVVYLTLAPKKGRGDYRDVYLTGARNLITTLDKTPVRRVIYTSSTRVYSQNDGSWVTESSPTNPTDERGRVLLQTEQVLVGDDPTSQESSQRSITILRLSGIYGPKRDLSERIRSLAGTRRDDGNVYVNLIHLDDIVAAMCAVLASNGSQILNLSNDQPILRSQLYDRVLAELDLPPISWASSDGRLRGKRVSNQRLKQTLGLTLNHPHY